MSKFSFLHKYLNYDDMNSDIDLLYKEFPKNVEIEKIHLVTTAEGRSIIALRIYPRGKKVQQPTIWMDANMHSAEIIGTNTVLAHIDLLAKKLTESDSKFYNVNYVFIPRICPDGAEQYFTQGKKNRSNARDSREKIELGSFWNRQCLVEKNIIQNSYALFTNKQRIGFMRRKNDAGTWVQDEVYPQLIRKRELGDNGPFYDLYPEGIIENYDGLNIPPAACVGDNEVDLNRNFPVDWAANQFENKGGKMPLSEPESRAIADFAFSIPQIYFWLNYHSFGGVFIRPLEAKDDTAMDIHDRSIYHTLDRKIHELTGYPAVSCHNEFTYIPGKPLQGCLTAFSFQAVGAISYVCELWDLPKRIGRDDRPFVRRYDFWTKTEWRKIYEFDRDHNKNTLFGNPWVPFTHPQLGAVEISEFPMTFGIFNPPEKLIAEVVNNQMSLLPLIVDIAPQPKVTATLIEDTQANLATIQLTIANNGFLPTNVSTARVHAHGKKKIVAQIVDLKNAEMLGENSFHCDALSGYAPVVNGWLISPDLGSNTCSSYTLKIPLKKLEQKNPIQAVFKVHFPNLGDYFAVLGEG